MTRSDEVHLTLPIRPDMRLPLWTRPGVRRQPIEPPWRKNSCVPWVTR